jgi:hypothetical protein
VLDGRVKEGLFRPSASLCALEGVNWVRNFYGWESLEPRKGQWVARTPHDAAIEAFEPWNEACHAGEGHTGAEIASLQKASYLGLKAGNPNAIVCQNAWGSRYAYYKGMVDDFHANEPWPYFESMNFHHYRDPDEFAELYDGFRSVSCGRPLWVTEVNLRIRENDLAGIEQHERARRGAASL